MSDLIGYAVAWKSPNTGVVNLMGQARLRHEVEVLLAAKKIESQLDYFIIEIYPDSRAVSPEMREEVAHA